MFPKLRFVLIDCRPFSDHLNKAAERHVRLLSLPPAFVVMHHVAAAGCQRAALDRWDSQALSSFGWLPDSTTEG